METKTVIIIFAVIIAILLLIDIGLVVVCILFRDFRYEKKSKEIKPPFKLALLGSTFLAALIVCATYR